MINGTPYRAITFFSIFLAIFWAVTRYSEEKGFLRIVMLGSFCYGVLIAVLVRTIFGDILEDPAYFPDAYFYLSYAAKKVAEWQGEGRLGYIPLATKGYIYFIAVVYLFLGQSIYAVIFVQLVITSLIPILTFLIAREFFSIKTAKLTAILVALFPDFYVWSSFALKEIVAVFSIFIAVYQFLRFRKHPDVVGFLAAMTPLAFLLFARPHFAIFLGLLFGVAFMRPITVKRVILMAVGGIVFSVLVSLAGLPGLSVIALEYPLFVYSRGEILVTATLSELLKMVVSGQLLPNLLLGISRYLISPLPWQATNAYQAVVPGIILWYFWLPAAIWGTIQAIRAQKRINLLLVIALFLIFWYGLISTGTDPRWRLMIVPIVGMLTAYGFQFLVKSLLGIIIWIIGVLIIWLFISIYSLGIKFVFWVLAPTLIVGIVAGLSISHKRGEEIIR